MSVAQLLDDVSEVDDPVDSTDEMLDVKVIEDLATLRLLSDPLRLRLIDCTPHGRARVAGPPSNL